MTNPNSPKQNWVSTALMFAAIFLGFNLFCNRGSAGPAVLGSSSEALQKMRTFSSDIKLNEMQSYKNSLSEILKQEVKEGKITPATELTSMLEGDLLQIDAQAKQTKSTNDIGQEEMAYQSVVALKKKWETKPEWKTKFKLAPSKDFPLAETTPAELHDRIVSDLDNRYKTDLVWGFVPGYKLIDTLVRLTGANPNFSYAFAAFLLALAVRMIVWPVAVKQFRWSRKMTQLMPMQRELEDAYKKSDPSGNYKFTPEYQQKIQGLYKDYGINPVAGCVPALLQMPLFLVVYRCMLHYRFSFANGNFLWINPAAHKANSFFGENLGGQDYLLLLLYGVSMVVSTYLQPVSDPKNAKQSRMIGVAFAVIWTIFMFFSGMFAVPFPSAFVLYWMFTNILATAQALHFYRTPIEPLTKVVQSSTGGVIPTKGLIEMVGDPNVGDGLFKGKDRPKPQNPNGGSADSEASGPQNFGDLVKDLFGGKGKPKPQDPKKD